MLVAVQSLHHVAVVHAPPARSLCFSALHAPPYNAVCRSQPRTPRRYPLGARLLVRYQQPKDNEVAVPKFTTEDQKEPLVEDVMSPHPLTVQATMPIQEAVRKLLDENVSGAPVVDEQGHLVGILSESDLIWKGAGAPQEHFIIPPVFIGFADLLVAWRDNKKFEDEVHKILAKTVGEAMTKNPVFVTPGTTMSDAAAIMLQKQVNRLPVVENGRVVGMLTRHDILRGLVASRSPFL